MHLRAYPALMYRILLPIRCDPTLVRPVAHSLVSPNVGRRVVQRFSAAFRVLTTLASVAAEVPFRQPTRLLLIVLTTISLSCLSVAATKPLIISFGKSITVDWIAANIGGEKPLPMKVRPLMVDARVKEFVTGAPHEITERLFVVRRVFRLNDGLPDDPTPKWQWQRGGWLLVDRGTGRISPVNLPDFDASYSASSWYRDYVSLLRRFRRW
jgi:hypothetical protein